MYSIFSTNKFKIKQYINSKFLKKYIDKIIWMIDRKIRVILILVENNLIVKKKDQAFDSI